MMFRRPLLALGAATALSSALPALAQEEPRRAERWADLRGLIFGDRLVEEVAEATLAITAPPRALDAGAVPVSIAAGPDLAPSVRRLSLVIDENPSPLAAVFLAGPGGLRQVGTRVRIDAYTFLHAVAETADGRLLMTRRFIKASGGCSAPMGSDLRAARERMGRARLSLPEGPPVAGRPVPVEVALSHPNTSGLQIDQLTRLSIPAEFVRQLRVTYAGVPVLEVESDISIAENPTFGFLLSGEPGGELVLEAEDNRDRRFTQRWTLQPAG
ncbi:quinoprotein dehydrogenase-associated SoxYZ-like carrier [Teichococcus oryzae]|nr:quinoprotein dehydrogenase-associated SoxYZ-like carrier [Pseudoroseomonas oryzae]